MNFRQLIVTTFRSASSKYRELHRAWISVSFRVGGLLPNSLLNSSVQQIGHLDMVLRCLEDETAPTVHDDTAPDTTEFEAHALSYQMDLSALWIGALYEVCRLLKDRKLVTDNQKLNELYHDLTLLRIPLEKHEIAKDGKIKGFLELLKQPPLENGTDRYRYDPKDPKRSHVMPAGLSRNGSAMWQAIDVSKDAAYWIERRLVSDRFLELWGDSR